MANCVQLPSTSSTTNSALPRARELRLRSLVHSPAEGRHLLAAGMSEGRGGGVGITTTLGAPAGSSSSSSDSSICTSFVSRSARTNAKEEEEEEEEGSLVCSVIPSSSCTVLSCLAGPTAGCLEEMEATPTSPLAIETIICSPRLVSGGRSELATVGTSEVGGGHWTRADWGIVPQSLSSAEGFDTSLHMFLCVGGSGGRVVSTVLSLAGESWDNIQLFSVSGANVSKGFLETIFPLTAGEVSVVLEPLLTALSSDLA